MNVENAAAVRVDESTRENAHVARETNQIYIASPQSLHDFAIVFFACAPATLDNERFNPALSGFDEACGIRLIADYDRDLSIWNPALLDRIRWRNHVRTATRDKNA